MCWLLQILRWHWHVECRPADHALFRAGTRLRLLRETSRRSLRRWIRHPRHRLHLSNDVIISFSISIPIIILPFSLSLSLSLFPYIYIYIWWRYWYIYIYIYFYNMYCFHFFLMNAFLSAFSVSRRIRLISQSGQLLLWLSAGSIPRSVIIFFFHPVMAFNLIQI